MPRRVNDKLLAPFGAVVQPTLDALPRGPVIERLWSKGHQLWKPDPKEIIKVRMARHRVAITFW